MTKKLEEEFNLPSIEDLVDSDDDFEDDNQSLATIQDIEDAISISEKINTALSEVRGMEAHDSEMDDIAQQAIDSYQQLMSLGMNMSDMAAGPVFNNAAQMLKIALDARDSKVTRKLKQVDLMLKKARLDQQTAKKADDADADITEVTARTFDRNDLLEMLKQPKD